MELNIEKIKKITNKPIHWKGIQTHGNIPSIIIPKTNKDYTNNQPAPFGKPRPLKQPRLGRVISNNNAYKTTNNYYQKILERILDFPAASITTDVGKDLDEINTDVPYTVDYTPIENITQTPIPATCSPTFCCNDQIKAIRRVVGANTNIKDNYSLTTQEYLQRRCLTYQQNSYDFYNKNHKNYVFRCRDSENGTCKEAFYNPSNQLFPVDGAVTNSNYTNKLKYNTVSNA